MKINYDLPLSPEQAQLVEENHNLIYAFLNKYKLPANDYYDLAALGLIRGVQAYCMDERLRTYTLSTICFHKMNNLVYHERQKRRIVALSLDFINDETKSAFEDIVPDLKAEADFANALDSVELEEMFNGLTVEQKQLLLLESENYTQAEMAHIVGISQTQVSRRLRRTKANIREEKNYYDKNCLSMR